MVWSVSLRQVPRRPTWDFHPKSQTCNTFNKMDLKKDCRWDYFFQKSPRINVHIEHFESTWMPCVYWRLRMQLTPFAKLFVFVFFFKSPLYCYNVSNAVAMKTMVKLLSIMGEGDAWQFSCPLYESTFHRCTCDGCINYSPCMYMNKNTIPKGLFEGSAVDSCYRLHSQLQLTIFLCEVDVRWYPRDVRCSPASPASPASAGEA